MNALVLLCLLGSADLAEPVSPDGTVLGRYYPDGTTPEQCESWLGLLRSVQTLFETIVRAVKIIAWSFALGMAAVVFLQLLILRRLGSVRRRLDGLIVSPKE